MNEHGITITTKTVKYGKKQTIIEIPWLGEKEKNELLRFLKKRLGTGGHIDEHGKIVLKGSMKRRVEKVITSWLSANGLTDTGKGKRT